MEKLRDARIREIAGKNGCTHRLFAHTLSRHLIMLEHLETRLLLSSAKVEDKILTIRANNKANEIIVTLLHFPNEVRVRVTTNGNNFDKNFNPAVTPIKQIRIFGKGRDDTITINTEDEYKCKIVAGKGDDSVVGSFGNDTILGGKGLDTLKGNPGNDRLEGGSGTDSLDGGSDEDTLVGGSGSDYMDGGFHEDRLVANDNKKDTLIGGSFNDTAVHDDGLDVIPSNDIENLIKK
jgi:hypothetical protein